MAEERKFWRVAAIVAWGLLALVSLRPWMVRAQESISPLAITTPTPATSIPMPAQTPQPDVAAPIYPQAMASRVYAVRPGDTLLTVALEVGIDLADVYCMIRPDFQAQEPLVIGDLLTAPVPGSLCHEIAPGDTVAAIAAHYERPAQLLVAEPWNALTNVETPLTPGHHLRIPPLASPDISAHGQETVGDATALLPLLLSQEVNADLGTVMAVGAVFARGEAPLVGKPGLDAMAPLPADWPYGSGEFGWPLSGWLTQGYKPDHRAIDVAAPEGTFVVAADRGAVIRAGWNAQGYGRFVIIDHNIDYITLYAHLSEVLVDEGDIVAPGQVIGRVGSTGNSTGPHLHFEIRDFGRRIDPLALLMR